MYLLYRNWMNNKATNNRSFQFSCSNFCCFSGGTLFDLVHTEYKHNRFYDSTPRTTCILTAHLKTLRTARDGTTHVQVQLVLPAEKKKRVRIFFLHTNWYWRFLYSCTRSSFNVFCGAVCQTESSRTNTTVQCLYSERAKKIWSLQRKVRMAKFDHTRANRSVIEIRFYVQYGPSVLCKTRLLEIFKRNMWFVLRKMERMAFIVFNHSGRTYDCVVLWQPALHQFDKTMYAPTTFYSLYIYAEASNIP